MRLDEYLTVNGYFDSRTKAKQAIARGEVFINDKQTVKPALEVGNGEMLNVKIEQAENFVSLGGYKLSKALKDFEFSVEGKTAADIGASTGGFTDCLIQRGAAKVFAVDLNDGLLHETLKLNDKVVQIVKNAKNLTKEDLTDIDLITADLSFISARRVLDIFYGLLPDNGFVILLIKPQFEMDERRNFKNGVIKDDKLRKTACLNVYNTAINAGFRAIKMTTAPINKDKNTEFLILLYKGDAKNESFENLYKF
ncbi:MAG: TlyA family RNA methyltransferase [Clostridia bacterium]|nr:TlyA family RNA methyltransferase [Clostridia bacterium]